MTTIKNHIIEEATNMLTKKEIRRYREVRNVSFIAFQCPKCSNSFGLKAEIIDCKDANIHYYCPYCGESNGLED